MSNGMRLYCGLAAWCSAIFESGVIVGYVPDSLWPLLLSQISLFTVGGAFVLSVTAPPSNPGASQ